LGATQPPSLVGNPTTFDRGPCVTAYQVGKVRKVYLIHACT